MKSLALLLMLLLAAPAFCQEDPKEDPGIPADFNDYLRKQYPGLDPDGKHNLYALKDPTNEDERHDYTIAMTQMILAYMGELQMGSTVSKVFDQYSRGKEGNQATFKVLHAIVLMHYPPGQPNVNEAQKLLHEAEQQAPKYAYPWFLQAWFFEYPRLLQIENTSPRDALAALDKALEIRPYFLRATLLKCQIYAQAQPPRLAEVKELIVPYFKTLPDIPEDFEDLIELYRHTHSQAELDAKIKELNETGNLTPLKKYLCARQQAIGQLSLNQFDTAIGSLELMIKMVDTKEQPSDAIWVYRRLSECWGSKAKLLKDADPELREPGNQASFDQYLAEAARLHEICANIEREHLPLAVRGREARMFTEFLLNIGKVERALEWLGNYLKGTDLAASQRNVLQNLHDQLSVLLNPTEEGLLDLYESYLAADNMDRLMLALQGAEFKLRTEGLHFKTERAVKFFISQLDNRIRLIVGYAAILAADTAVQLGGEWLAKAGDAIATRLEKEPELNSDEQAELQATLCDALKLSTHRPSQERGIRHAAKLIEGAASPSARSMMQGMLTVWQDESFWSALKTPPAKPGSRDKTSPTGAAAWLKKLADAVKAETD
jgi:hypothetical protein